jgi:hypothetical protein
MVTVRTVGFFSAMIRSRSLQRFVIMIFLGGARGLLAGARRELEMHILGSLEIDRLRLTLQPILRVV